MIPANDCVSPGPTGSQDLVLTRLGLLRPSEILVQRVEEPTQEVQRIRRLSNLEPVPAPARTLLQQLVGTDLPLERFGVPHLATEHRESLDEFSGAWGRDERVEDKVVAQGDNMDERMEDRVGVAVGLDVVQSDESGIVGCVGESKGGGDGAVDGGEERGGKGREEEVFNIVERGIRHLVSIR